MSAGIPLVFEALMCMPTTHVAAVQDHDVVGICEVKHMCTGSSQNPWVILQVLARNPVDNVIEEGRENILIGRQCEAHMTLNHLRYL